MFGLARGVIGIRAKGSAPLGLARAMSAASPTETTTLTSPLPSTSEEGWDGSNELVPMELHTLNPGIEFDLGWVNSTRINASGVNKRAATLGGRRTVKKDHQMAWLLRAITSAFYFLFFGVTEGVRGGRRVS